MTDGVGAIGLARRCVAALAAIKEADGNPTPAQRAQMAGWAGWGPVAKAFGYTHNDPTWEGIRKQLFDLLDPRQLQDARNAVDTAFYTPKPVTAAAWGLLTGLGFTGGAVLEPGCGAGYFMSAAPAGMPVKWTGVEADDVSARIAAALHPGARIIGARLEKTPLRQGTFDAAIGNVPFSQAGPYDPTAPPGLSLHNYFIWRALAAVRAGGIVALVTSRYTMDSVGTEDRQELARLGDFLGAIRLPGAALAAGGTEAVTDIVVFRRHLTAAADTAGQEWLKPAVTPGGLMTTINPYFLANPGMVLGELQNRGGQKFGMTLDVVPPPGADLPGMLTAACGRIIEAARTRDLMWLPATGPAVPDSIPGAGGASADEGTFTLHDDGTVTQVRDGRDEPVKPCDELITLIRLRDAALALFAAEADRGMGANQRTRTRQHAMRLYQEYTAAYGYLNRSDLTSKPDPDADPMVKELLTLARNGCAVDDAAATLAGLTRAADGTYAGPVIWTRRRPRMGGFRKDPDFVAVLALEIWDDETQSGTPAPILVRHVNAAAEPKTRTDDPGEALALCLDTTGRVDLDVIAKLLGVAADQAASLLGDLVYEDPDDGWVAADEYLSGNVRRKLAKAKLAAGHDERWRRNVAALEAAQPADLGPEQINAQLGSPWIPPAYIEAFIAEILWAGSNGHMGRQVTVNFVALTAAWEVHGSTEARRSPHATTTWGTARVNCCNLVEDALNGTTPVVYDKVPGIDRRIRNDEETQLAADKIRDLQERFAEWLWEHPQRAEVLCRIYNQRFNAVRVRRYDGSLLTYPGMDATFRPYQSQRDMTWRAVCTPASLCGFAVGAGKTATMGMIALTLRRLGLARKPCMIVPNHLLEQETAEIRRLYPGARILMVTREDLTSERRRGFAAKCATRDWDVVIMTHQQFMSLPVSPAVQQEFIAAQIEELDAAVMDPAVGGTRTGKQLATKRKKLTAQHEMLLDADRDGGVTFEQTGIDYLLVDEAHYYKNLAMSCRAEGFSVAGSKRADDLAMKLGYLRGRNGRCGALFTGTPISNSLAELHVLLRYLAPGRLAEMGLTSFDGFAGQYIRYATTTEVAPDGSGFRSYRRPQRYCNLPELRAMLGEVADVRTKADLGLAGPQVEVQHVTVEPQPELGDVTAELVQRADDIRGGRVNPRDDNMLKVCTDGRRAALDLRLTGIEPAGPGKIEAVAEQVAEIYRESAGNLYPDPSGETLYDPRPGALQLVFCDQGTPSAEDGTQTYGRFRDLLTAAGVPREKVAFIHDAKSHPDRSALFARCRSGEIAVLVASTEKAGTGVNIQARLAAVHHMDAPWRPADVEQRDGRGDRPGNGNTVLRVFRYVTERSFDAYMWQALRRKLRFISQILTGSLDAREVDAENSNLQVLSYGELMAMATGQPLLMELSRVNAEIARLRNGSAAHKRNQARMFSDWQHARQRQREMTGQAEELDGIADAAADSPRTLTGNGCSYEGAAAAEELRRYMQSARDRKHMVSAGRYRGVSVSLEAAEQRKGPPVLRVRLGAASYSSHRYEFTAHVPGGLWRPAGPAGLLTEIDTVLDRAADLAADRYRIAGEQASRVAELEPMLNQEWPHKGDLAAAVALRAQVEAEIDAQVKPRSHAEKPVASAA